MDLGEHEHKRRRTYEAFCQDYTQVYSTFRLNISIIYNNIATTSIITTNTIITTTINIIIWSSLRRSSRWPAVEVTVT